MPGPLPVHTVFLEYQILGSLHLAAAYARWAGGYGDADVLARTDGHKTVVYPETGNQADAVTGQNTATRTSNTPTQITVPLDAINDDLSQLLLAARSLAADLLNDYGRFQTTLLQPDGTVRHQLLTLGEPLKNWLERNGQHLRCARLSENLTPSTPRRSRSAATRTHGRPNAWCR
jgi:hypothetical protein